MRHRWLGVIALPSRSRWYEYQVDVAELKERHAAEFRTKHDVALDMVGQAIGMFRASGLRSLFVVVFDGAYAACELILPLTALVPQS